MAQMVLYDACINLDRVKTVDNHNIEEGNENCTCKFNFTFDDIDACFKEVSLVKYNQRKDILEGLGKNYEKLKILALPSGRTVGGTSWLISYGQATVVYAVGINAKKESVLDGLDLKLFPTAPSLLIVDVYCSKTSGTRSLPKVSRGKKKKESSQNPLVTAVMETVRKGLGGNILIPCESGGRALELMQLLAKNVMCDKSRLEVDSLVYLTPMAPNIVDFAKAQLEWMSDSLCDAFYKGKENPFEFNAITPDGNKRKQMELLKCVTSLEELDGMENNGVKIVLATDSSVSTGFSKELLLRWGGDPSCKVIFTSEPETNSLGAEVLKQINAPPVLVTVVKRERVLLQGEELHSYMRNKDMKTKEKAEAELQDRREAELNAFVNDVTVAAEDSEDEMSDEEVDMNIGTTEFSSGASKIVNKHAPVLHGVSKYAKPKYAQFENVEFEIGKGLPNVEVLEYGKSIPALHLPKVVMPIVTNRLSKFVSFNAPTSITEPRNENVDSEAQIDLKKSEETKKPPSKFILISDKVQLTCAFSHIPLEGRVDLKTLKRIISVINPQRVIVLTDKIDTDYLSIVKYARDSGNEAFSPFNNETVSFRAIGGSKQISLHNIDTIRNDTMKRGRDNECVLNSLKAGIKNTVSYNEGESVVDFSLMELRRGLDVCENSELFLRKEEHNSGFIQFSTTNDDVDQISIRNPLCLFSLNRKVMGINTLGRMSFGEVKLNPLKSRLINKGYNERKGMGVEYKLGVGGATLLCNQQSTIRKINENDFLVEGSPGFAFDEAKHGVYSNFSFK